MNNTNKPAQPSPYEPRLREIATTAILRGADVTATEAIEIALAVLRSELYIESLMETISLAVEAPNVPHPAALRKLREWRDKWKR